jgi:hypothetical protein
LSRVRRRDYYLVTLLCGQELRLRAEDNVTIEREVRSCGHSRPAGMRPQFGRTSHRRRGNWHIASRGFQLIQVGDAAGSREP